MQLQNQYCISNRLLISQTKLIKPITDLKKKLDELLKFIEN